MNTMSKLGRSISRTFGMTPRKRHNTVKKVMNEPNLKKITVESIQCKHLLRDLHLVKDKDLKERIRKLCDFKTRQRSKRTVSAHYMKNSNSFKEQVDEVIAEACHRIVTEYVRKHKMKEQEKELRRRLDELIGYDRTITLNDLILRLNKEFGTNISPNRGSRL